MQRVNVQDRDLHSQAAASSKIPGLLHSFALAENGYRNTVIIKK